MNGTALASGLGEHVVARPPSVRPAAVRPRGAPFLVRPHVGRLVELKVFDLGEAADVATLTDALVAAALSVGGHALLLADHRAAGPFPQEVGDAWSRDMRRCNPFVERSAILLDRQNETFNLQIARVVRCAGSPRRRWFYDAFEAGSWLAEVGTPTEIARVDELLGV